ncbi:MAG: hypothetical protein KF789_02650 [Bdellovibrionaceae bacterium]|nr:hypothetical protein [Pseudobdellovibrionaceae bacterium]
MRNPLLIFPIGILFVIVSAFVSVQFGAMTMNELIEKMKTISFLLLPIVIFVGVFAFDHFRGRKNGKD